MPTLYFGSEKCPEQIDVPQDVVKKLKIFSHIAKDTGEAVFTIPPTMSWPRRVIEIVIENASKPRDKIIECFNRLSAADLLDVLELSNYLDCEKLLSIAAVLAANRMRNLDTENMKIFFGIN